MLVIKSTGTPGTVFDRYGLILSGRRVVGAGDLDRADGISAVQAATVVSIVVSSGATLTFQPTVDAFNLAADSAVYAFAPQADGKVLLGGSFTSLSSQVLSNLARLNADGTLDSTFRSE